jgi:hypothetical protein
MEVALVLQQSVEESMFYDAWHPVALAALYGLVIRYRRRQIEEKTQGTESGATQS